MRDCPHCGHTVVQRNDRDGGFLIRTPAVKLAADGRSVLGQCQGCKAWIPLPLIQRSVGAILTR